MIIIPALVYLRYSPHTATLLQKFGWSEDRNALKNGKTKETDNKTLH